jgi:type VI secretion system secreted protein VgrG
MAFLSEISIQLNGEFFKDFERVQINQSLYGYNSFSISCRFDAMEDTNRFLIEKSKEYLGAKVLIKLFTQDLNDDNKKDGLTFRGIVTRVSGTRSMDDNNAVLLEGGNYEALLNSKSRSRGFVDKSLEDVVKEVLLPYDREVLRPKIAPRSKQRFEYLVQYEESDLDFLRRLSARFGEWFYHDNEELIFGEKPFNESVLIIGDQIAEITYSINASPLHFLLIGYNRVEGQRSEIKASEADADSELNMIGKFVRDKSKQIYPESAPRTYQHFGLTASGVEEALRSVVGLMAKADAVNLTNISGTATVPTILIGQTAVIKGLKTKGSEKTDYGKFLITRVSYSFNRSLDFHCSFDGVSADASIPENTDPWLIRYAKPQVGSVFDNLDPEKLGRVRLRFPWMKKDECSNWVSVQTPYITPDPGGIYAIPHKRMTVMVNFEGGDVERPYCESMNFYKKHPPPEEWVGNYNESAPKIYAIRTQKGNTIEFHDADGDEKIRIYTWGNNHKSEIELNDSKGELNIVAGGDMKISVKGKLEITASEMVMKTDSDMQLKAGAALKQDGANVELSASSGLKVTASSIEMKANGSLAAEASGSVELKSSGVTTIKGSVVQIN